MKIIGDGKTESVTDNDIKISPLQFSVNGGVGAECKIDRTFSIYAEPKVGYYFDNGSNVATLYKDKPLNIDINVGLRLNENNHDNCISNHITNTNLFMLYRQEFGNQRRKHSLHRSQKLFFP